MVSVDQHPSYSNLSLCFKLNPKKEGVSRKSFAVGSIQSAEAKVNFKMNLQLKLEDPQSPIDPASKVPRKNLENIIMRSSEADPGFSIKKNKD